MNTFNFRHAELVSASSFIEQKFPKQVRDDIVIFFPFIILLFILSITAFIGCSSSEAKPIDIFSEDNCSNCRMQISNQEFASEIITQNGDVFKFDDIGCLENFRKTHSEIVTAKIFMKDYESKNWINFEQSTIVQTGISTPMGSGKVAFAKAEKAKEFTEKFPVKTSMKDNCCSTSTN